MTTSELVAAVILKATGKRRDLQQSSAKYQKIFGIANLYIQAWQNEPNVDWMSLYDPEADGGVLGAGRSHELDIEGLHKISDTPSDVIAITNGDYAVEYQTVPADQLKRYEGMNVCAQIGDSLWFAKEFTPDSVEYGGQVKVPIFKKAPLLVDSASVVPVDNPLWLVTISAAEYVRTERDQEHQYPNLVNEANQLMQKMIDNNGAQLQSVNAPVFLGC